MWAPVTWLVVETAWAGALVVSMVLVVHQKEERRTHLMAKVMGMTKAKIE